MNPEVAASFEERRGVIDTTAKTQLQLAEIASQ